MKLNYPLTPRKEFCLGQRFLALFVSICLLSVNAIAGTFPPSRFPSSDPFPVGNIPSSLGSIEERFSGSSGKTLIFIQDAHDSLEAQENIARLIHFLVAREGIRSVYEEGYEGEVPSGEFFGWIQDPALRRKVSYFFLDQLRLGSAEYAHINRRKSSDFKLIGIESLKLYRENGHWYRETAKHQKRTQRDLKALETEILKLVNLKFPRELKGWMRIKKKFDEGELGLLEYLKRMNLEEKVLTLGPQAVFQVLSRAEGDLAARYLKNESDRKIFRSWRGLETLRKLSALKITSEEFDVAQDVLQAMKTEGLAQFLADQMHQSVVLSKRWEKGIQKAVRFYQTAQARDRAAQKYFDQFLASPEKTAILVYGGFHKNRIVSMLRRKGIGGIVISPRITQIDTRHQGYYQRLMTSGPPFFEFPAPPRMAMRPESLFLMPAGRAEIRRVYQAALSIKGPLEDDFSFNQGIERQLRNGRSEIRTAENPGQTHLVYRPRLDEILQAPLSELDLSAISPDLLEDYMKPALKILQKRAPPVSSTAFVSLQMLVPDFVRGPWLPFMGLSIFISLYHFISVTYPVSHLSNIMSDLHLRRTGDFSKRKALEWLWNALREDRLLQNAAFVPLIYAASHQPELKKALFAMIRDHSIVPALRGLLDPDLSGEEIRESLERLHIENHDGINAIEKLLIRIKQDRDVLKDPFLTRRSETRQNPSVSPDDYRREIIRRIKALEARVSFQPLSLSWAQEHLADFKGAIQSIRELAKFFDGEHFNRIEHHLREAQIAKLELAPSAYLTLIFFPTGKGGGRETGFLIYRISKIPSEKGPVIGYSILNVDKTTAVFGIHILQPYRNKKNSKLQHPAKSIYEAGIATAKKRFNITSIVLDAKKIIRKTPVGNETENAAFYIKRGFYPVQDKELADLFLSKMLRGEDLTLKDVRALKSPMRSYPFLILHLEPDTPKLRSETREVARPKRGKKSMTVFMAVQDLQALHENQFREDIEKMALWFRSELRFVFYGDQKTLSPERHQRLEALQGQLGADRIVLTSEGTSSVFRRFGNSGLSVVIFKILPAQEILKAVMHKKRFTVFQYLEDEIGAVAAALYYAERGLVPPAGTVLNFSQLKGFELKIRDFHRDLIFARSA